MMKNRRSKSLKDSTPNPDSRDMKTTANDNFINISFKYFKDTDKSPAQSISDPRQYRGQPAPLNF